MNSRPLHESTDKRLRIVSDELWADVIGDPVIADAIRDRLEHSHWPSASPARAIAASKRGKRASKKKDS